MQDASFKVFPMRLTFSRWLIIASALLGNSALAVDTAKPDAKGKDSAMGGEIVEDDLPTAANDPGIRKEFSRGEIQRICAKFDGQLIAYYGDVYKVEHCVRRPVIDTKTVYSLQRRGTKVLDVDGDVVAALPEGEPIDEAWTLKNARNCRQLEGHYITFSNVDVYFVEHCKKRLFPDWASYIKHRERRGDKKGEIFALSWVEFDRLEAGNPEPSALDDELQKLLSGDAGVEVIPVNEACQGLEGRLASYYSRVYKIEHCKKREIIDPDEYLIRLGRRNHVVEMKSEQWLSLPDGRPIAEKNARSPSRVIKKTVN